MKDYNEILAIDPTKIDDEMARIIMDSYKNLTHALVQVGILERIFEIVQGKTNETNQLAEIVGHAITHCTIAKDNPRANTYDPDNGVTIPGPIIYQQEYIHHTSTILPLLEDLHKRILATLKNK